MKDFLHFVKWSAMSLLIGITVGILGALFGNGISLVTAFWKQYSWIILFMPLAGIIIVYSYKILNQDNNKGTDTILQAAAKAEHVSFSVLPLIIGATLLSHLTCSSVGREGAALQIGGTLAAAMAVIIRLNSDDYKICILCGMSSGFAALFGTPLTACIFALEILSVGRLQLQAFLPCAFAAFSAAAVSSHMGIKPDSFSIGKVTSPSFASVAAVIIIGILSAFTARLTCNIFHKSGTYAKRVFPNPYVRAAAGSVLLILLTFLIGNRNYNGSGMGLIEYCFEGSYVHPAAFLIKILFTAIAITAGFKGGEIVPALCIGATLGYQIAPVFGISSSIATALGMICLFAGVTNCPLSAICMALELFGFEAMPYYVLAVVTSFYLSGNVSLYHEQTFSYEQPESNGS